MGQSRMMAGLEVAGRPGTGAPKRARVRAAPLVASLLSGLIASLCCGGGLVFAALGLGAAFGALQMWRYIPQVLALGAASVVAINYWYYRRRAYGWSAVVPGADGGTVRGPMLVSGLLGLLMMAASFTTLEWLNHAVVHAAFMARPEYAHALIPGVPDGHLRSVALTFLALPVLAALPLPRRAGS